MESKDDDEIVELELKNNSPRCKLCGKKLRRFRVTEEYSNRCYHLKCFRIICEDVRNFQQVAYTKYGYKKKFSNGKTLEENREDPNPLVVTFD